MNNWLVHENLFEPIQQNYKETVFTIGNGYLSTRGAFEEGYPGDQAMTLVHGIFDDAPIVMTELANAPNWLDLQVYIDGEPFLMNQGRLLAYERSLDLRQGVLRRQVRWQSRAGKTVDLVFERFTSLADEHLLALRCRVEPLDLGVEVEFRATVPGHVDNRGLVHWDLIGQKRLPGTSASLLVKTKATQIQLCEAFHLKVTGEDEPEYTYWDSRWLPTWVGRTRCQPGEAVAAEKIVAIFTSRDTEDPQGAAEKKLAAGVENGYGALLKASEAAWTREWADCNITIEGDDEADRALRYNLFQLLIAAPRNDDRVSIAAKTLSGYGYRGHAFWDTEIFLLPFFIYTRPEIARNLLVYRYRTLPGARRKAEAAGYEGAMYAWESAVTGDETTPRWVPGPRGGDIIRIWCGDIELHISADIAYAVHQYWLATGDDAFLCDYGAEILLDTARFWGSRAEWHPDHSRYEIRDVVGPDEYHDHVSNNAYTNQLARWNLQTALETLEWLQAEYPQKAAELSERLDLNANRLARWQDVIEKMVQGYDADTGLFEQFEGFFSLKDVDLKDFEPRSISLQALLGIEGVQAYQIIKQPDVLMLLYLLNRSYNRQIILNNFNHYTPKTDLTFGSSLGPAIQAALAAQLGDVEAAYQHFMHAASTDLEDTRRNSAEGFHAATAGGLWQAAVFGFGGLEITQEGPVVHPRLPSFWRRLAFRISYHGRSYSFDLRPDAAAHGRRGNKPSTAIRGAIFDLDGVLTDTSEFHYRGWQRLADEEGMAFDRAANEALRGIPRRESLLLILGGRPLPEEKMRELMERKNQYYLDQIQQLSPENLLPGARQLLEEMRRAGVKIAIGSASKNAQQVIEKLGIATLIDAVSDGFSVERQKPAPDLFLHAAGQLGLKADECVVFEDSEAGIEAALAGGMLAVGLGPPGRVGKADLVLPSLQRVSWSDLLDRLGWDETGAQK